MGVFRSVVKIASPSLGGFGTNTWHFRTAEELSTETEGGALAAAKDTLETFYSAVAAYHAGGTQFTHDGVWVAVDEPGEETYDSAGWLVSSGGGNPLPPQTCLVVGWRTGSGDRSGTGRTFLGPLSVATLESNGTPEEAARTAVNAAAAALIDAHDGAGNGAFAVWSQQESIARDFTTGIVRNVFGTLRSRRD